MFRGVSLALSVLTLSLAISYFASAWTEPSVAPPGGNAPAPINVSFTDQSKEGRIGIGGVFAPLYSLDIRDLIGLGTLRTTGGAILNTGGAPTGLIVQNGNVGIGTTDPENAKLQVMTNGADEVGIRSRDANNNQVKIVPLLSGTAYNPLAQSGDAGIIYYGSASGIASKNHGGLIIGQYSDFTNGIRIDEDGNIGIGTATPNAELDINGDSFILEQPQTPAASSSACAVGMHAWDTNYIYVCVAANTWKRSALSAW